MNTEPESDSGVIHCVVAIAPRSTEAAFAEWLSAVEEAGFSTHTDVESDVCEIRIYSDGAGEAGNALSRLRKGLAESLFVDPECVSWRTETIRREDWAESWKRHFRPMRVSQRLVVKPSWEKFDVCPNDVVLEIDPGMSFGTGQHGTTQACLQYLDELRDELGPVSVLDAGCGSGILSLAACKLGYSPVVAFDNDPDAARIAGENLLDAGCGSVEVICAELATFRPDSPSRVVLANILAPVLVARAESLVSFVATGDTPGYLILSGILREQYPEVKERFEALSLRERDSRTIAEWTSGCFGLRI